MYIIFGGKRDDAVAIYFSNMAISAADGFRNIQVIFFLSTLYWNANIVHSNCEIHREKIGLATAE